MGYSSEVIEEFRISTVNLDLSTGLTATGAINAVTRSGGRDFTGTAFYFFEITSSEPIRVLNRSVVDPDPFFQRRQFGLTLSGPVRQDRVFFTGSWQRNDQRAAVATTLLDPDFSHLSRITTSPSLGNQYVARIDGSITPKHTAFLRYAYDGSKSFAPAPGRPIEPIAFELAGVLVAKPSAGCRRDQRAGPQSRQLPACILLL